MCGIFGIISASSVSREQIAQLGELNKQRGNLAFGGFWAHPEEGNIVGEVFRWARPFAADLIPTEPAQIVLGHIRAPTGRHSSSLAEVHPFAAVGGLLAHNGLLLNHEQFPHWRLDTAVTVDSQIILGGIQTYLNEGLSTTEAIRQMVERLEGQQACWFWSHAEQVIYVWRVMSPIYIGVAPEQIVFSSVKSTWTPTLLPEGVIFRIDWRDLTCVACGQFSFYSPYQF
jgi:glutamine phosphoribosylpyrophosphate amidotransferase